MSAYTLRPLSDRTWLTTDARRVWTPFDSAWTDTLDLLEREVRMLGGKGIVLGVDVHEGQIRLDGTLRARATAETPAVEIAFTSKHGPMLYRCDKYVSRWTSKQGPSWQQNVRAIAKTLEALRAVERYGASNSGEQYRGYRQIAATASTTSADARARLAEIGGGHPGAVARRLIERAQRAAHPDHGGTDELWHEVQQLAEVLGT